jgi:predicted CopG family antitoxin
MFKHKHKLMVTKTITITEDAYNSIKSLKGDDESFSRLFIRLSKEKGIASKYLGVLKGDVREIRKRFKDNREKYSKDYEERQRVLFRHKRNT